MEEKNNFSVLERAVVGGLVIGGGLIKMGSIYYEFPFGDWEKYYLIGAGAILSGILINNYLIRGR